MNMMINSLTPCLYSLNCSSPIEARNIAKALLEKRLVVNIDCSPIASRFWSKNQLATKKQYLLTMLSVKENYTLIELEIKKYLEYELFILSCSVLLYLNHEAKVYLRKNLSRYQNSKLEPSPKAKSVKLARKNPYRLE